MQAIETLKAFFGRSREVTAVYLYGRYGSGPSFADTDIEVALVFREGAGDEAIRDYLERLSDEAPLGGEPGILMPYALNTHILPVVHEVLSSGTLLVENDGRAREAFVRTARARIDAERGSLLDQAREPIMQARAMGSGLTGGRFPPRPPRYLDPIRIGWRLGRILTSTAVIELLTREAEATSWDPDRLAQVVGGLSNAAGAATGIAKAMLSTFEMERPPRRWQIFFPLADAGLVPMDLALALAHLVELRWQLLGSGGLHSAERILGGIRVGSWHLLAFARMAAWYCDLPGGPGAAKVH